MIKYKVHIETSGKYHKYTKAEITGHQELLKSYEKKENTIKERAEMKNELESKLYYIKNHFDSEFMRVFSKEDELTTLKKVVEEKLEWLDENSYSGDTLDFKRELGALMRSATPIFNRSIEHQNRYLSTHSETKSSTTPLETSRSPTRRPWNSTLPTPGWGARSTTSC